jgi:hypothetical protein
MCVILLISHKHSTIEYMFFLLLWWQQRSVYLTVGEATTVSRSKTAKENSSYFQVMLCALSILF